MATPQAVVAPYASDVLSGFDIYKPEKMNKLFRIKGDQGMSYLMILKSLGFELPTARDDYEHYEERFIHDTFLIGANSSAGAAGASVTITVSPNSIAHYGAIYYLYPRLWDTVLFQTSGGEVTASVTAVTNNNNGTATIKVTPNGLLSNIPALTTGLEIVIISNGWAEGSTQPPGRLSGTDHYINHVQIVKESLNATGSEMTNQDWFDTLQEDDGGQKKILGYVMKGQIDLDYRIAMLASNALLFQQPTDNTNTDLQDTTTPTNAFVKTTEGLIPATRRAGNTVPYTPGLFSTTKFNTMIKIQDREFCGNDVLGLLGIDLHLEIEDTFVDYFKETEISYVVNGIFKGNEELATSVGFTSFRKGSRTFNFQRMGIFSHPKVGGASGYNFSKMGLFLPIDMKKDYKTGNAIPSIGCRYKELGPYSRKMEVWNVSGAGAGAKVIPQDLANFYLRTHIGAHHIGANRFMLMDPQ